MTDPAAKPDPIRPYPLFWGSGQNNISSEAALPQNPDKQYGQVRSAVNLDIRTDGSAVRRTGYTRLRTGRYTSLWGAAGVDYLLAVKDGALIKLLADATETTLRAAFGTTPLVAVLHDDGAVYYSNGVSNGRIATAHTLWGPPVPPVPVSAATTGSLSAGGYQVSYTFLDSDGVESGASATAYCSLPTGGGIALTGMPNVNGLPTLRVYLSPPDGDLLYHLTDVSMGTSSLTIRTASFSGKPLATQFLQPPPPFSSIASYAGRIWGAVGNTLFFTQPGNPFLCDLRTDFFLFGAPIQHVLAIGDGLYVLADRAYFLSGTKPQDMRQIVVDYSPAISGTGKTTTRDFVPLDQWDFPSNLAAVWWSQQGELIYGLFNGRIIKPLKTQFRSPQYPHGLTVERLQDGLHQLLTLMQGDAVDNNAVISDFVVAEVHSNGLRTSV